MPLTISIAARLLLNDRANAPDIAGRQRHVDPARLHGGSGQVVELLRQRVRIIRSGERRPEDVVDPDDLDPELREQLRALGYIK